VVVDVLVTERDGDNSLADQRGQRVDHLVGVAMVGKARRNSFDQRNRSVGLAQQHRPGIRCHRPAVERRNYAPAMKCFEFELLGDTLCLHRTPHQNLTTRFSKTTFSDSRGRCTSLDEKPG
jgi:hypothetical protein